MSTATRFKFLGALPFCAMDMSGVVPGYYSHVDNLTLEDVMAFAWNFETATITMTGSAAGGGLTINGNCFLTLNPMASDRFLIGSTGGDMWFGNALTSVALGSWPAIRQPRGRVCWPTTVIPCALLNLGFGSVLADGVADGDIEFVVGTDPGNPGRYRLYYHFTFHFTDIPTSSTDMYFTSLSSTGFSLINSGTFDIAGITLSWNYFVVSTMTPTAGSMSATSGSFTY